MKIAVYYLQGDDVPMKEIHEMLDEMDERGLLPVAGPEGIGVKLFTDPNLFTRDGLLDATRYGDAILLPRLGGRGRVMPFLDFLAKSGLPLYIPQIPTFPHGEPLGRAGLREIFAFNQRMKSKKFKEAAKGGKGGDTGHVPDPSVTKKAQEARKQASEETAREREEPVLQAYITYGSYNAAAKHLNEAGVPTPSGSGEWYGSTVRRLLKKLGHV